MMRRRRAFQIDAPQRSRVVSEAVGTPEPGEVVIEAEWGAVSTGSELLVYRGDLPAGLSVDDTLPALRGERAYPLRYGYTLVGRVVACGDDLDASRWRDRRVFAFHPHASYARVGVETVLVVPDAVEAEYAPLYANTETALSLAWDGAPAAGETILVLGLGIVGMLLTALTSRQVPGLLVAVEPDAARRRWAERFLRSDDRAPVRLCSSVDEAMQTLERYAGRYRGTYRGFDLVYEVSGRPEVLDDAVASAAFGARVVVGSWYGSRASELSLGGRFHRSRVRIISSQVSTIPLGMAARFDYERRTQAVWSFLPRLALDRLARRVVGLGDLPALFDRLADGERPEPWIAVDYRLNT